MFKISFKYLDAVLKASITSAAYQQKETSQSPSHNKTGLIGNGGSTIIGAHRNPNYLSKPLCAKSNKNVVQQKGQRITYILIWPMHYIF